jgi:hypothetical protein
MLTQDRSLAPGVVWEEQMQAIIYGNQGQPIGQLQIPGLPIQVDLQPFLAAAGSFMEISTVLITGETGGAQHKPALRMPEGVGLPTQAARLTAAILIS